MQEGWKEVSLGEIFDFKSGLSKSKKDFGFGYTFLTFKDVFNNFFVPEQLTSLANTSEQERHSCSIKRGDVFLTRTSETQDELGMSCVALKDYHDATFNGFTKRLRPKSPDVILPEYAAFYFRSSKFRKEITTFSSLSTRASLNNDILNRLTISLPNIETQKKIGDFLKALTDKIELNRQTNQTLEAMAQALFTSWFVDFEPFGGVMPSDWDVKPIGTVAQLNKSSWTAKKHPDKIEYIDLSCVKSGNIESTTKYSFSEAPSRARRVLQEGDTIVGTVRPKNRSFAYINKNFSQLTASTGFAVLTPNAPCWREFVYLSLTNETAIDYFAQIADGAAYPMLRPNVISEYLTAIPSVEIAEAFSLCVSSLLEKRLKNLESNIYLAQLRDTLLPKLMRGEINVPY